MVQKESDIRGLHDRSPLSRELGTQGPDVVDAAPRRHLSLTADEVIGNAFETTMTPDQLAELAQIVTKIKLVALLGQRGEVPKSPVVPGAELPKSPVAPAAKVSAWQPDLAALQLDSPHDAPRTGGATLAGRKAPKII